MPHKFKYMVEYAGLRTLLGLFWVMGLDAASAMGGALFETLGPRMGISRVGRRNIKRAFPDFTDEQVDATLRGMWNNLGRVMAEYPHLKRIADERITIEGLENMPPNGNALFVSGHIANWEVMPIYMIRHGVLINPVYRAPNNPYVDRLLLKYRSAGGELRSFGKNLRGLTQSLQALQKGESVGMLIDQKMNTGIEAMFFGHPAMTSTAFVELSRKTGVPLMPGEIKRENGARFALRLHPALPVEGRETQEVVAQMHGILEDWIRKNPAQWLWIHRRWKEPA